MSVKLMTMLLNLRGVSFFLLMLIASFVYAIGDSAGGCGRGSPVETVAIHGTPQWLDTEIDRQIEYVTAFANNNHKLLTHPNYEKAAIWIKQQVISLPIKDKRAIFINWWSGCEDIHLLELAAAGGNQNIAQYLLNAGANPNIGNYSGDTIFMRCANLGSDQKSLSVNGVPYPTRTKMEADRKIAVYSQLLAKGGDLNRLNQQSLSALHLCKDPEAIAFFLKKGANPNLPVEHDRMERLRIDGLMSTPILDFRIKRIVKDYDWERDANFSILQQLLPVVKNKALERETLWSICYECSNPRKAEACNRLSKMIDVPDQEIFNSKEQGDKNEVAVENCRKYSGIPSPPVKVLHIIP